MPRRPSVLALVVAATFVALAPGCAVLDGLGGDEEDDGVIDPPEQGAIHRYRFQPPFELGCPDAGGQVAELVLESRDGQILADSGPFRVEGTIDPSFTRIEIICQPGNEGLGEAMGSSTSPGVYLGTYHFVGVDGTPFDGDLEVTPFQ